MKSRRHLVKDGCTTIGDRVKIKNKSKSKDSVGTVRFIGAISGKSGIQYGVELDAPDGNHSGSFHNVSYFKTTKKHGVFVQKKSILKTNSKNNADAPRVTVGSKVHVIKADCTGIIRFIGSTEFKSGIWYGIQLEAAKGKNNGTVKGRSYFECEDKFGSFVKSNGFTIMSNGTTNGTINGMKGGKHQKVTSSSSNMSLSNGHHTPMTSISSMTAIERRKDLEKVINVLNEKGSSQDIDGVIASYDDRKEVEDQEWFKLIATLKVVNDELVALRRNKNEIDELTRERSALQSEIETLKAQNQNQSQNAGNGNAEKKQFERRLKFETDEMRQKFESQIRTLKADKQRLEAQIASNPVVTAQTTENVDDSDAAKSKSKSPPNENGMDDVDKDEMIKQLQRDQEQKVVIIRAKDEIIDRAKEDIAKLQKEIAALKEEEEKEELQMNSLQKDRARKLLQERVSEQQQNSLNVGKGGGGSGGGGGGGNEKKQTLSEVLNESTAEDAVSIIHSMNVIKFEYDRTLKRDTYNLDLTNNPVLRRLTDVQRKQFMFLLAHCICDKSGQQKVEKVRMSNMAIDDKVFPDFMNIIIENLDHFAVTDWTLDSNKIGNEGMKMFAAFLELTPPTLEAVKMNNNKTNVSTPVINGLLTSIEKNDVLCKFVFEWRLTQHRDRIEKQMRKNQDLRRKAKWANKK